MGVRRRLFRCYGNNGDAADGDMERWMDDGWSVGVQHAAAAAVPFEWASFDVYTAFDDSLLEESV